MLDAHRPQALPPEALEDAVLGCLQPLIARIAIVLSSKQPSGFKGKALMKQVRRRPEQEALNRSCSCF